MSEPTVPNDSSPQNPPPLGGANDQPIEIADDADIAKLEKDAEATSADVSFDEPEEEPVTVPKTPHVQGTNLAALRERVVHEGLTTPQSHSPIPSQVEGPAHPPITPPAKSIAEIHENLQEEIARAALSPEKEIEAAPVKTPKGSVRSVRTFRDDIAQVVERRQISLVSAIAAEEEERGREKEESPATPKSAGLSPGAYFMLGMTTVFFIVGGAVLAGYFTFFKKDEAELVVPTTLPTLVFAEQATQLEVTGMGRRGLMDALSEEKDRASIRLGAVTAIHPLIKNGEGYTLMSTQQFLTALETRAPEALSRSLSPLFMIGVHEFDGNEPFLIFKATSYESAFASMLEWESSMSLDLSPLFGRVSLTRTLRPIDDSPEEALPAFLREEAASSSDDTGSTTPTETGSSTIDADTTSTPAVAVLPPEAPTQAETFTSQRFTDAVIRNKDVRVLKNSEGKIALLYSFLDPSTILITTNEYTFIEILTRYTSKR